MVSQRNQFKTILYSDSDHAGDYVDRKSTSGICTFMGCCLISWFSKKQTALAISTIEAEYVFAGKACQQALWMKQALVDYGIKLDDIPVLCDNKGVIDLSPNGGSGGLTEGRLGEICGGNDGSMSGVGEGKVDFMGGMGGGLLAIRSMVSNDG
nr:copia protein [Tanacetum cinerariifolium]